MPRSEESTRRAHKAPNDPFWEDSNPSARVEFECFQRGGSVFLYCILRIVLDARHVHGANKAMGV